MQIDVPFFSQYASDISEEWQHRSCGIVALRMALTAKRATGVGSTPLLIQEGIDAGAYLPTVGWKHDGLLGLAEAHGVHAYRREFGTRVFPWRIRKLLAPISNWFAGPGIRALRDALDKGTIPIVSVTLTSTDTHLVVLMGYETGAKPGFYYNDSAGNEYENKARFMDIPTFSKRWRQMALFIG